MDVVSVGPLRVTSIVWQPRPGAWALTTIIKATYRLEPLRSPLADVQDAPLEEDDHWDDDRGRSLSASSDLVPFKRRPEVLLVGHAFAPGGEPVRSLLARLQVGEVDKTVEVWCDRAFSPDGQLREGRAFTRMPLRWERAAGGPGTANPVGMRFDAAPDTYGMLVVPNLQPPGRLLAWRGDTFEPIGFGPLAPTWPSRAGQLSPEAAASWAARWFTQPLSEGPDVGFFNVAPPDQRTEELRPDERIMLENLHPVHARLVTNLAGVRPRAVAERATGEREELRLVADTLSIDTDRGVATLVWRGSIGLRDRAEAGRVAVWTEGQGAAPAPAPEIAPREEPDDDEDAIRTMIPPAVPARPSGAGVPETQEDDQVLRTAPAPLGVVGTAKVLPFREGALAIASAAAGHAPEVVRPAAALAAPGSTLSAPLAAPVGKVLPFGDSSAVPERPVELAEAPQFTLGASSGAAPPWMAPPEKTPAPPAAAPPTETEPRELPPPPPMIGPLATPEMAAQSGDVKPFEETADEGPQTVPRPPATQEQELKKPGPEEFPLERCAALTVTIARRKADKRAILEEEGLTEGQWAAIESYWAEAIREETKRGKKLLLDRFDTAYVAKLEEERGPIQVAEYARLMVAAERSTSEEALMQLGLPRSAMIRVERIWMRRMAEVPGLGEETEEALARAREGS